MYITSWPKELESGNDLIDKQHKEFFRAINKFYIKYKFIQGRTATKECLNFLDNYTLYHFQLEEAFQRESKFDNRNEHEAKHKMLAIELKKLSLDLKSTDFSDNSVEEFHYFITKWLKHHVLKDDIKFSKYYFKVLSKNTYNN